MVVLSKLLYGSVRVRSYDWVAAPSPSPSRRKCGLARCWGLVTHRVAMVGEHNI